MDSARGRRTKLAAAGLIIAVAAAGAIGVSKFITANSPSVVVEENSSSGQREQRNPACEPLLSDSEAATSPDTANTSTRLTNIVQTAADLLRVNGAAWGPQVAVGSELSIEEAFEHAGSVPGDAMVAEMEWLRQAQRDGLYDGPDQSLDSLVRHIDSTTISDLDLVDHLGPNWQAVIDVIGTVAANGFDEYVSMVRASPAMRAADALDIRSALRGKAVALGFEAEWDGAQEVVAFYFQQCTLAALAQREVNSSVEEYVRDWDLAEAVARDAVAAAFAADFSSDESGEQVEILARGLQIVQVPSEFDPDYLLTRSVDPYENLHPEEAELLKLEDPLIEGE
ncbi:hypothetical protein EEB12_16665 [Rhodococcus sp. WS1]|uniref:hypothetical protein n=2 Tax=unclassified Rhodococcus (in: high G+C Gram-positive bacteria) TaxID=192944 RepID=UPI001142EA4C|nr:hypothetical protein [Rhodococcus sp. WS1]ROZ55424.1 hypothetical protein EEB12_16665 [Rhodococcus sp. WS1]TQC39802.1 hypothetical protein EEB16_08545 [Rhodococcus sp. WS7]